MTLAFHLITGAQLLSADVIVAIDPRNPDRELSLYSNPTRHPTEDTIRVLQVVLEPRRRDEQIRELRSRLAALRTALAC